MEVARRIPPSLGPWSGWDWNTFYNAILTALQMPGSQQSHYRALNAITSLPGNMLFTEPVLIAAWIRFINLYPMYDQNLVWKKMVELTKQAGRLKTGVKGDWRDIEVMWQAWEAGGL